jgi:thioredoxin 1
MNSYNDKPTDSHAIVACGRVASTTAALAACLLFAGCSTGKMPRLPWSQASADPSPAVSESSERDAVPTLTGKPRPEMRQSVDGVALASFDMPSIEKPTMATHAAAGRVTQATSASFDELVLQSDVPVLVDFSAKWCGPCKQLEPRLEELARETPGAKVVKVDIDESPEIAARYQVGSIPSLRVIRQGKVTASHVGLMSKEDLRSLLTASAGGDYLNEM